MKNIYSSLFMILFSLSAFSQSLEESIRFKYAHQKLDYDDTSKAFILKNYNKLGLSTSEDLRRISTVYNGDERLHERYQQYHNGLKVFGGQMIFHSKKGKITHITSDYVPTLQSKVTSNPRLSNDEAVQLARILFTDQQTNSKVKNIELSYIDKGYPNGSNALSLVYLVDLESSSGTKARRFILDANDGSKLFDYSLIPHGAVEGKGSSQHYGEVVFTVDQVTDQTFRLTDPTRGIGGNSVFIGQKGSEIEDEDNEWNFDESPDKHAAIDAHYCTERFYDLMKDDFGWLGVDGHNSAMNSIVYPSNENNIVNAYWRFDIASFGNGNCHHGSLTTLEVVGHEFMHGITQHTSDLVYAGESGAINESLSDVFGKILEYKEQPDQFSWDLGHSFLLDQYTEAFRSFEDPNSREMPYTYLGDYWLKYGNVHTNSSVGNHFFYRLVEGGSGVTEGDEVFNFDGIGINKAGQLIWELQSGYFTPNTNYKDYYRLSLIAAADLWGNQSQEYEALLNAWKVVGLPAQEPLRKDLGFKTRTTSEVTCLKDDYYTVETQILNLGETTYSAGTIIQYEIRYEDSIYQRTKTLSEPLGPSEYVNIEETNLVRVDKNGTYLIRFDIKNTDYSALNNTFTLALSNFVRSGIEIDIDFYGFQEEACSSIYKPNLRIQNNSCDDFINGAYTIEISFDNGEKIEITDTLKRTLHPGNLHLLDIPIEYNPNASRLKFYARVEGDQYTTNNGTQWTSQPKPKTLNVPYYDDMEDQSFINSFYNDGYLVDPYTNYLGERMLYIEGLNEENNTVPCPEEFANFNDNYGAHDGNKTFSACLDLSDIDDPQLSFNLIMFRNEEGIEYPELENLSSIMAWEYVDENQNVYTRTYLGLEEGKDSLIRSDLPGGTKGTLSLHFYTRTGSIFNATLDVDYDAILLDNLSIGEKDITAVNDINSKNLKVYPNPAKESFIINFENENIKKVNIYNLQGILMTNITVDQSEVTVSTTNYPSGLYSIVAYTDNGIQSTRIKIIK